MTTIFKSFKYSLIGKMRLTLVVVLPSSQNSYYLDALGMSVTLFSTNLDLKLL